jgi:GH15 family glucan-1,4-alpha-glucosidase
VPVATSDGHAVGICSWNAGTPEWTTDAATAPFVIRGGDTALIALAYAYEEPLVMPARAAVERRLDETIAFWRAWAAARSYEGPWRDAVIRSALALKLMIFAPSGASAAAATTSLPEEIGGIRNWDYRFCWIRDSTFLINALLQLGCRAEAQALFWWFMQATALTEPELQVLYRLDGAAHVVERRLAFEGYRRSAPVRVGNAAVEQRQHDTYGHLLETAWLYGHGGHRLDRDTGDVLARMANLVCDIWRRPDCGIWEVRDDPRHFTHSKVTCWVALDRAARLADQGVLPAAHAPRWREEADAIAAYVNTACWSEGLGSFTRSAGEERTDASLLMLSMMGFCDPCGARMRGTIDAVSRELRRGIWVYRYHAGDGLPGAEGCFVNCSFWLADALGRAGRVDEAATLMQQLLCEANDVGLFAEEVVPDTAEFLGNFPQALVHLSLIDAALAIQEAVAERRAPRPEARAIR